MADNPSESTSSDGAGKNGTPKSEATGDDFTQFQFREYENISQAHFKTNEVLATFYRYYLLITAIPITTVGLAIFNIASNGISDEGRILAYYLFGISAVLLSLVGVAVISYIEGLRLDAILYARVVNSIRKFFFKKSGAEIFGKPMLPTGKDMPSYGGVGASFIIYHACAFMNSAYFGAGWLALTVDKRASLENLKVDNCHIAISIGGLAFLMEFQIAIRYWLIHEKSKKGH